jgi:hypothetical protein
MSKPVTGLTMTLLSIFRIDPPDARISDVVYASSIASMETFDSVCEVIAPVSGVYVPAGLLTQVALCERVRPETRVLANVFEIRLEATVFKLILYLFRKG